MDDSDLLTSLSGHIDIFLSRSSTTHGMRRALRHLGREIRVFRAQMADREPVSARRVQIGGGRRLLPGFLNIDALPPADLLYDVRQGLPVVDGQTDFVFAEHVLEHLDYPVSAKRLVAECYRILRPEGRLVLGVPDAKLIIDAYVARDPAVRDRLLRDWYASRDDREHVNTYLDLVNYVFRDQDDSDRYTPHLWAYDLDRLVSLCAESGFRKVEPWPHDPTIANPDRAWGSVYTIAYK